MLLSMPTCFNHFTTSIKRSKYSILLHNININKTTTPKMINMHSIHTLSSKGIDIISPLIHLTQDQIEYYNLSRNFADNGIMISLISKYVYNYIVSLT